ncbi:TPA: phage antirepressor KilAC domain-containing protein [Streptococcus suis]
MELQIINQQEVLGKNFTIYGTLEDPLFLAKDVADWIEHSNPTEMLKGIDKDEKLTSTILRAGQTREVNLLTENGLYEVLMQSRKPIAKQFKKQVKQILKSIRKHGMFATDELLDNPDFAIATLQKLKEEREERKRLEVVNSRLVVENQIMQPKAQYFDDLVDRKLLTNFRDTAKMLKVKQKEFIDFLLSKKYIFRDKKGKLMPYQQYNNDLFEIKESKGVDWEGVQTLITPRGRETFNILLNS